MTNDWREFHPPPASPAAADPWRRLRLVQAGMAALLAILLARAVQLELTQGAAFRAAAAQPLRRTTILPAPRGRILAADGTVLACDRPLAAAAAEIERHPQKYPRVKIVRGLRRSYPCGTLAAHVLGYVGPGEDGRDGEPAGRDGVERQYDQRLRGRSGASVQLADHAGRVLKTYCETEPRAGDDLRLTILPKLQQTAERLLDDALERRAMQPGADEPSGGAVAVLDLRDGGLLAAASAPRFDPNLFLSRGDAARIQTLLHAPDHPLFDRVVQMALPPGSTFKLLAAVALLESGGVDPQETFHCQGYLYKPTEMRCAIFVRQGVGHGDVTLADALAQSCNVYFFHHAARMGPEPLVRWAARLGFGRPTGVDLPGEAAGIVPTPQSMHRLAGRDWQTTDTQMMAIGQGVLTATPLQVLRLAAAVATGKLIAPHVAAEPRAAAPIEGLRPATLAAIRRGLERAVADPKGAAYGALTLESLAVAAKTGTASVGEGRRDHAWLAGYVPAAEPRFAFVIVLEHAGDAAAATGPVAQRLLLQMRQLGLL